MTHDTHQELDRLRDLAKPYRYRVILNKDEEAIMPGVHGRVEWYAFNGKTLVGFTEKKRTLHKLLSLSWVTPHQVGDEEGSVTFPCERLKEIGTLLKLRRQRKPETSSHLVQFQYPPRHEDHETGVNLVQVG